MKIWLDDVRTAPDGYIWCKSVNCAIKAIEDCELQNFSIEIIDCDHDLGDYQDDGGDGIYLLDYLIQRGKFYPIRLHTANPVGRLNMKRLLRRYWGT